LPGRADSYLVNPSLSQQDCFRFWLQDYEDPDPAKAEQYARWRELRKLHEANQAPKHLN